MGIENRSDLVHPKNDGSLKESRWWMPEFKGTRGEHVTQVAAQLYRESEALRMGMWRWASLYANDPFLSTQLGFVPRTRNFGQASTRPSPLALNAVKAVSDTYVALLTADRPKVSVVTSGADDELQRDAADLEKFIEGVFYENRIYRTALAVNYDVCKCGMGVVKICDERPRRTHITIERVMPWEILADPDDALYGDPQCIYHVRRFDRIILQELWPDFADQIASKGGNISEFAPAPAGTGGSRADYVVVVEAWRKPPSADVPGMHVIACGEVCLLEEEWTRRSFPFEFLYRQRPGDGIWGTSLGQELSGLQLAVNKLLRDIQRAQNLVVGHYLIENNADVNTGSISDRIGGFIRYRGVKPEYIAPPPVADQNIVYLQQLWSRCFETIGISQQAAQSQKPAGLNSGKAIMVYADIQSQRFKPSYQEYQDWFLRIGQQVIETARDMDEEFYVRAAGSKIMKTVSSMAAGKLEDHEFALKLYPTNALADDPASRIQQVQDLMVAKLLTDKEGRRLLDNPDLEALNDLENASFNLVAKIKHQILDGGEYIPPEPYMDLGIPWSPAAPAQPGEAIKYMQNSYLMAKMGGVREDRLERLDRWITTAMSILNKDRPPVPPPGLPLPPGAMPPPGAPLVGPPGAGPPPPHMLGMPLRQVGGPLAPGRSPPLPTSTV